MEPPACPPPRPREEAAAETDYDDDEEEDPVLLEPWWTSSSDSEPEQKPKRRALEPAPPPPTTPSPAPVPGWAEPPEQRPDPTTAAAEAERKSKGEENARPPWPGPKLEALEPPACSPPRPREAAAAEVDFDDEEEDPEENPVLLEREREPERQALEPPPPPTTPSPAPAPAWTEPPEQHPDPATAAAEAENKSNGEENARPPWPGDSVFPLAVLADEVGGVIGHRGETIRPSPAAAPAWAEPPEQQPDPTTAAAEAENTSKGEENARPRWPGWPGDNVFRLVVPADQVGSVIGYRGEIVRRLCNETRARVNVLGAPLAAACQIVLVSAREEVEAELSPAMNAAIKIFKHINDIEEINSDGTLSASAPEICCVRLLVPSIQAAHLIGKQWATINSIQESTGATIRIIDEDDLLNHETVDERIVEIHGPSLKVLNALKSVLEILRKFLVHHGVLHLFERKNQDVVKAQDAPDFPRVNPKGSRYLYGHDPSFHGPYSRDLGQPADSLRTKNQDVVEAQDASDFPLAANQDFLLSDEHSHGNPISSRLLLYGRDPSFCGPHSPDICHATDSLMMQSRGNPKGSRSLYGRDPSFHGPCSRDLGQLTDSLITKTTWAMQIPLAYAEEIIGVRGENIEFIRSVSGAAVVLAEIGDHHEVRVMIQGTPSQVQTAHRLVQRVISADRAPQSRSSYYTCHCNKSDPGLLNSQHAGSRSLHSPPAIATNRDYLPRQYEEQTPHGHWRNCVRCYRP